MRSGSIRARCAARARACSCRKASPSARREAARAHGDAARRVVRSTKPSTWARSSRRCSSNASGHWSSRASTKGRRCWQPSMGVPDRGLLLSTDAVHRRPPASTVAQVEIFGPVLVTMTFRTPDEAVALANNTPLRARRERVDARTSISRSTSRRKIKAGVVWVNCDQSLRCRRRIRRLSRERIRARRRPRGIYASNEPKWLARSRSGNRGQGRTKRNGRNAVTGSAIDRTAKLYIGGKQARPDSGYTRPVHSPDWRI